MRVLVDEDLASRELLRRLEDALPGEVLHPDRETSDDAVWARAAGITGRVASIAARYPDGVAGLILVVNNFPPG